MTQSVSGQMPLVAVVTPVYNGGRYLRETMEQVQAQTYPNLVHCVLDNASTDATAEIIASFANGRVPVITRRNPKTFPVGDNWNLAHDLVPDEATYMRLLCADDGMHPDCIRLMVEVAERDPEILVVCTNALANGKKHTLWPEGADIIDGGDLIRASFRHETGFLAMQVMTRTSVKSWRKPLYDDSYRCLIDTDYVLAVLERGKMGCVHDYVSYFREHDESFAVTTGNKHFGQYLDWLKLLHRFGKRHFSPEEFKKVAGRYERHYLRRVLMRLRRSSPEVAQHHLKEIAAIRGDFNVGDYAGAVSEWPLIKLGFRPPWSGYPH